MVSFEKENSVDFFHSKSCVIRWFPPHFFFASFGCKLSYFLPLVILRNCQFMCNLTLKHLYLLCSDRSCSLKVSSAQYALPLTPLFSLYLVLGDTFWIAFLCAKGLHLSIFWSFQVIIQGWNKALPWGAGDLKELLICNLRLIEQCYSMNH